ncbi:MAG: helix-turn-helix domain-containing protein [bacterium]
MSGVKNKMIIIVNRQEFGFAVMKARLSRGLTLKDVEQKIGIRTYALRDIERGRKDVIKTSIFLKLRKEFPEIFTDYEQESQKLRKQLDEVRKELMIQKHINQSYYEKTVSGA